MREIVGWVAGRYHPYTLDHQKINEHAREVCAEHLGVSLDNAILAVGVRDLPVSWYNPFDYDTRREMILNSHKEGDFEVFKLTKKGFGARREILDNVDKAPLFTREKAWKTLTKLIRLPVIYEERTGGAATDVRELWYNQDRRYTAFVPEPVAKIMKGQSWRIEELVRDKDKYSKFFGKKPWKK